jgi:sensor domain CHASE-containing protein
MNILEFVVTVHTFYEHTGYMLPYRHFHLQFHISVRISKQASLASIKKTVFSYPAVCKKENLHKTVHLPNIWSKHTEVTSSVTQGQSITPSYLQCYLIQLLSCALTKRGWAVSVCENCMLLNKGCSLSAILLST